MRYNYTDAEVKKILASMEIVADTREQQNGHILDYLAAKKVPVRHQKLDWGDYTAVIPENKELGIYRDMYLGSTLTIERKGSLDELSGNVAQDRQRFENELLRKRGRMILLIEGASYDDILAHNYRTKLEPKSFIGTLKTFESRYGIQTAFTSKKSAGNYILHSLLYETREVLKNGLMRAI